MYGGQHGQQRPIDQGQLTLEANNWQRVPSAAGGGGGGNVVYFGPQYLGSGNGSYVGNYFGA